MAMRSGAHEGLMCPLENGVVGIEISKSSRRQPCCCAIDMVICFYTVACCLLPALRVIWVGGHGCFFEQPACRDLVYIIESQGDIMNDQMQVM